VGANIQQVMGTITVMTGTPDDLKPDSQLAVALLASSEHYDNLEKVFHIVDSEIQQLCEDGLRQVKIKFYH
jgi:hypothetical protein